MIRCVEQWGTISSWYFYCLCSFVNLESTYFSPLTEMQIQVKVWNKIRNFRYKISSPRQWSVKPSIDCIHLIHIPSSQQTLSRNTYHRISPFLPFRRFFHKMKQAKIMMMIMTGVRTPNKILRVSLLLVPVNVSASISIPLNRRPLIFILWLHVFKQYDIGFIIILLNDTKVKFPWR